MNCIIVDDEHLARQLLAAYVAKIPDLHLLAQCDGALPAIEAMRTHQPDLAFLDIQMPDLTGLDLIRSLARPPQIVLTTAYAAHAVAGFELDVADYLLKPIAFERFVQAINKVRDRLKMPDSVAHEVSLPAPPPHHFFVKADYKLVKVRFDDILYIEGLREYVSIFTAERRWIVYQALKNLEILLPAHRFARVHKSYIVPLDKIDALYGNTIEIQTHEIPIGKLYKDSLMEKIEKL